MASPPFNLIIEKIPDAQIKLERQFWRILKKIAVIGAAIALESVNLPEMIKCSDPRVVRIKALLTQFQLYLQEFIKYLGYISITATILFVIAQGATAYLTFQNALQFPTTPGINAIIEGQAELLNKILDILKKYGPLLALFTANIIAASVLITPAINLISQICKDDIPINKYSAEVIKKMNDLAVEVEGVSKSNSRFYQDINISEEDIKSRQDVIDKLLQQQRDLSELIEAPSKALIVDGIPDSDFGNTGDYAIDMTTKTIYGPKPSDTEWNEGIKY
jgi:uncharacterized protein YoxC